MKNGVEAKDIGPRIASAYRSAVAQEQLRGAVRNVVSDEVLKLRELLNGGLGVKNGGKVNDLGPTHVEIEVVSDDALVVGGSEFGSTSEGAIHHDAGFDDGYGETDDIDCAEDCAEAFPQS